MQNHDRQDQPGGFSLAGIYHVLFRQKWRIIGLTSAGLLVAALIYFLQPLVYSSEAKLLIRYVLESRVPSGFGGDPQIKTPDSGGANIINTEIEIIKSLDLAAQVAEVIGPEKILGKGGGETNIYLAGAILKKGLTVEVPPGTDILRMVFQHPNREIVQPVLEQFISAYMRKHVEIHSGVGSYDDLLSQHTSELRNQLAETEAKLRTAKTNAGLMSVEDAQKAYAEAISKIREVLFTTQAELAEHRAALQKRQELMPVPVEVSTNQPDVAVPPAKIEEYQGVSARLQSFRKREGELLTQYFPENSMVQGIREQIASAEKLQKSLEAEYPTLTKIQLPSSHPGAPLRDWPEEAAQIAALQAKLEVLTTQSEKLNAEARIVNELEPNITELQRKKDLEEAEYLHSSKSLKQSQFDGALREGKLSNINVAQNPTPPYRESRRLVQTLAMIVGAGVLAGIALAGLCELGNARHRRSP